MIGPHGRFRSRLGVGTDEWHVDGWSRRRPCLHGWGTDRKDRSYRREALRSRFSREAQTPARREGMDPGSFPQANGIARRSGKEPPQDGRLRGLRRRRHRIPRAYDPARIKAAANRPDRRWRVARETNRDRRRLRLSLGRCRRRWRGRPPLHPFITWRARPDSNARWRF